MISQEYLRHVVDRLASLGSHPRGFRVAGTPEERAATAFIAGEMRDAGLVDVVEEPVPVDAWRLEEAFVEFGKRRFECASFGGVPETGAAGITGELVPVGRGGRRQLDRVDVAGKVALVEWQIQRLWPYHVGLELGLRGAAAMIVAPGENGPYYQAPHALGTFDGIWHEQGPPCVTIRQNDAAELAAHAGERVHVVLRAPLTQGAEAANVVGTLPGRRGGPPVVVGGHHDGWFQAAFDDASAVAITLALARSGLEPEHPIVFVSHTAEEYGITNSSYDWCYGAWYQVAVARRAWADTVRFYLNIEGSGRPERFTVDAPPELTAWSRRLCRAAESDGLLPHGFLLADPTTWTEVWPFLAAGIPSINVSTFTHEFDRTEYHTQYDTADKIDFDYLTSLAKVCRRFLVEADAGAADALDFRARARHLRKADVDVDLDGAMGRERFTAIGRGLHGLDAREGARYPHEQTAADVERLRRGLEHVRAGDARAAARTLSRVGLNWLCTYLSHEAFRIECGRRGRDAPRATWAAMGDPDSGPDLWEELASLRGEAAVRPPGTWLEESLERHLDGSQREHERRLTRMEEAVRGRILPLPEPRSEDLPA